MISKSYRIKYWIARMKAMLGVAGYSYNKRDKCVTRHYPFSMFSWKLYRNKLVLANKYYELYTDYTSKARPTKTRSAEMGVGGLRSKWR